MKKKTKVKEEGSDIKEFTPEQILQDFIARNQGENRHQRRFLKKMTGLKIIGTNKPYVKIEKE